MDFDFNDLDDFTQQYVTAALWSTNDESTPEGGVPMEESELVKGVAPETLRKMADDCKRFREQAGTMLDEHPDPTMAAHDFWLTRNGQGAGFWDGDWPVNGDALTELSKSFGEVWLYVGDDGLVYQS